MARGYSGSPLWQRISENARPDPITGCIEWGGSRTQAGYGVIQFRGKKVYVHRLVWAMEKGREPTNHLCHRCDNPACFNLFHLFEGDDRANSQDKMFKGRAALKLKPEQVREIYADKSVLKAIAKKHGVALNTVWSIKRGIIWAHVTKHDPKPSA